MRVVIAQRFAPFSHNLHGTSCVIPGSAIKATIYGTRLFLHDICAHLSQPIGEVIFEGIEGPIEEFTVQQDLEKQIVKIRGRGKNGYFFYTLKAHTNTLQLSLHKAPINTRLIGLGEIISPGEEKSILSNLLTLDPSSKKLERLSLGSHKKQEWERIYQRKDLREILPFWFFLGQQLPPPIFSKNRTPSMLEECKSALAENKPEKTEELLLDLIRICFDGIFNPIAQDTYYQGLRINPLSSECSPLALLTEGTHLIRSFFVQTSSNQLKLLPHLLPQLHCGRMQGVYWGKGNNLELEWRQKKIRKVLLEVKRETFELILPSEIQQCRMINLSTKEKKSIFKPFNLELSEGRYFLDRFES